nr:MAG TPA: hypothetical protein [Caudoviricetes sp.]
MTPPVRACVRACVRGGVRAWGRACVGACESRTSVRWRGSHYLGLTKIVSTCL